MSRLPHHCGTPQIIPPGVDNALLGVEGSGSVGANHSIEIVWVEGLQGDVTVGIKDTLGRTGSSEDQPLKMSPSSVTLQD